MWNNEHFPGESCLCELAGNKGYFILCCLIQSASKCGLVRSLKLKGNKISTLTLPSSAVRVFVTADYLGNALQMRGPKQEEK